MTSCYFCGSEDVVNIFNINECPLAGNFLQSPKDDELFKLDIIFCDNCRVAQVDKDLFIPKEKLYKNYFYKTHTIQTLIDFFKKEAKRTKHPHKKLNVLEIGGNSCPLGEESVKYGNTFVNVDPSDVALDSKPEGVHLVNDFFNIETSKQIYYKYGKFDMIYSANNFAHMEDINEVIEGIRLLLDDNGELIIQVQDFEYLLEEMCFPFFYHEHLFYYTVDSLANVLRKSGLYLKEYNKNNIHGKSINCTFTLNKKDEIHYKINIKDKLNNFKKNMIVVESQTRNFLDKVKSENKKIVAYGASGQANIFFSKLKINNKDIEYIIDDSPLKENKYTPYSHMKIKNSEFLKEYNPDYIFVTAYNFINEIKNKNTWFKGKWVVPLPKIKII